MAISVSQTLAVKREADAPNRLTPSPHAAARSSPESASAASRAGCARFRAAPRTSDRSASAASSCRTEFSRAAALALTSPSAAGWAAPSCGGRAWASASACSWRESWTVCGGGEGKRGGGRRWAGGVGGSLLAAPGAGRDWGRCRKRAVVMRSPHGVEGWRVRLVAGQPQRAESRALRRCHRPWQMICRGRPARVQPPTAHLCGELLAQRRQLVFERCALRLQPALPLIRRRFGLGQEHESIHGSLRNH
jgi:hypothetical protein